MTRSQNQTDWISTQQDRMIELVDRWASVNSGTGNTAGVQMVAHLVAHEFLALGVEPTEVPVPEIEELDSRGILQPRRFGPARLSEMSSASRQRRALLAIHMDTVYSHDSTFQSVSRDESKMYGPGVADAKGGIVVMLLALQALERVVEQHGVADFGWEVLLNPDEEVGSPASKELLRQAAGRNHLGLLFEPALPDGSLAYNRKGSANFHIRCRGKSAHAGRHFHEGQNAIAAAAKIAAKIHALNGEWDGTTLNVAKIDGGGPLNMVPDLAVVRLNVRYSDRSNETEIEQAFADIMHRASEETGTQIERFGNFTTPPKQISEINERMFGQIADCGRSLGINVNWQPTGGVCDGNRLAGWGLPNVDSLGVRGGGIHSHDEFLWIDSFTERAALVASLLIGWASGDLPWPPSLALRQI